METGILFNLQKFSLNDGPGIRTVVFFKGCPLCCRWCSNPESQSMGVQPLWNRELCRRCGHCAACCPKGAVRLTNEGSVEVSSALCDGCGLCAAQCPGRALELSGKRWTVEEVLAQCLQDRDFYEESHGGVTLSGGEALSQPAFALALLRALKAQGISTALETTGFAPPETFRQFLPLTDLFLFDIKHWNEQKHREGTGVSNQLPLENLKEAIRYGAQVLPRLPVIPGYNNCPADAQGFARRLREAGAAQVQLLPFHQFGESKYEMLGKTYAYRDVSALHEEDLAAFRQAFLQQGIQAFF